MPISEFHDSTDGLRPDQRKRDHYVAHMDVSDGARWVPYAERVWIQPCRFNVTSGGFTVLLKALPGASLGTHYHTGTVQGYTLQGNWRYLEHDWVAKPGTFIFEPAGEAHTLVITDDSPEPALILFMVEGALVYLDNPADGHFAAFEDGFTALELVRDHYRRNGFDAAELDQLIR